MRVEDSYRPLPSLGSAFAGFMLIALVLDRRS